MTIEDIHVRFREMVTAIAASSAVESDDVNRRVDAAACLLEEDPELAYRIVESSVESGQFDHDVFRILVRLGRKADAHRYLAVPSVRRPLDADARSLLLLASLADPPPNLNSLVATEWPWRIHSLAARAEGYLMAGRSEEARRALSDAVEYACQPRAWNADTVQALMARRRLLVGLAEAGEQGSLDSFVSTVWDCGTDRMTLAGKVPAFCFAARHLKDVAYATAIERDLESSGVVDLRMWLADCRNLLDATVDEWPDMAERIVLAACLRVPRAELPRKDTGLWSVYYYTALAEAAHSGRNEPAVAQALLNAEDACSSLRGIARASGRSALLRSASIAEAWSVVLRLLESGEVDMRIIGQVLVECLESSREASAGVLLWFEGLPVSRRVSPCQVIAAAERCRKLPDVFDWGMLGSSSRALGFVDPPAIQTWFKTIKYRAM